jgi:hypothetical protein
MDSLDCPDRFIINGGAIWGHYSNGNVRESLIRGLLKSVAGTDESNGLTAMKIYRSVWTNADMRVHADSILRGSHGSDINFYQKLKRRKMNMRKMFGIVIFLMMGMLVAVDATAQIVTTSTAQIQNPMVSPIWRPGRDFHGTFGRSGTGEALQPMAECTEGPNSMVSPIWRPGRDFHGTFGRSGTGEALQSMAECTEGPNSMVSSIWRPGRDFHGTFGRSGTGEALQSMAD